MTRSLALAAFALAFAAPLAARESLGVYDSWAAFRDAKPQRCYAIAKAQGRPPAPAYATISTWPDKRVRGQLHLVLSRDVADKAAVRLTIAGRRFDLVAKGRNAWAQDARDDAAIIAALRSASRMSVAGRSARGDNFTDRYTLAGVATAMDAATVGCAQRR
ncbi:MAG: hypothetical protein NXH71_02135 [Erythrobacteraceae bacterium]|jgi:hypothetical protein|nr:hypothetical protein [Erythrobacteraceae bacterium]